MGKLILAPSDMPERWAALNAENARLRAGLERVAIVCTQNMCADKNHRMALDAVRQIANDTIDANQQSTNK